MTSKEEQERHEDRRRCKCCGGPIRADNNFGYCSRTAACRNAQAAAWREANRKKVNASSAAYREANRKKVNAYSAAYHAANREAILARKRSYYVAYRDANREKRRSAAVDYYYAHRATVLAKRAAHARFVLGKLPAASLRGEAHHAWAGGRFCVCSKCGTSRGWKTPSRMGSGLCKSCSLFSYYERKRHASTSTSEQRAVA